MSDDAKDEIRVTVETPWGSDQAPLSGMTIPVDGFTNSTISKYADAIGDLVSDIIVAAWERRNDA